MLAPVTFSDLLGYTSIACWLGAQFPQVLENWRRQSCEGLALPFLANWLLGDVSNLVGCILTRQLPFQTYLATYFVFVDLALVVQYWHYTGFTKSVPPHPSRSASVSRTRRASNAAEAARYRAFSAAAANIAATAALAAQHDELEHRHRWHRHPTDHGAHTTDDDVDEDALALLAESFHSERGHDSRRKHISWSIERHGPRSASIGPAPTLASLNPTGRGRSMDRELEDDPDTYPEITNPRRQSSRTGRRGGAMVFLGVWALFGLGTLAVSRHSPTTRLSQDVGVVLAASGQDVNVMSSFNIPPIAIDVEPLQEFSLRSEEVQLQSSFTDEIFDERAIGRIFAWLCTTLYLTSRLPQIWKNYVRKSVEGLSMYLFVFAFLGNLFYVASILTSPRMSLPPEQSLAFLKESIPYLLGSGGTLMFDVTIVTQSFIYRPRHRRHLHARHSEEAGLLTGDSVVHPSDSSLARGRTSCIRAGASMSP